MKNKLKLKDIILPNADFSKVKIIDKDNPTFIKTMNDLKIRQQKCLEMKYISPEIWDRVVNL